MSVPNRYDHKFRHWLAHPGLGLWLWGKSEGGKSKAACAVALDLFRRGQNVVVVTHHNLFSWLKDRRMGLLSDKAVLDGLIAPSVLLLDELSQMFFHWPLAADLRPIFRARVAARKPTIITSNGDIEDYISFCDSQASDYLSGFLSLKFPTCMEWPAAWTVLASHDLRDRVEMMIQAGWLTPEARSIEIPRRLARLKAEEST